MSRHRNIRTLDADEEYESYNSCYGHSVEDDFCISPRTEAQFLYNRNNRSQNMSAFFEPKEPVLEEDLSSEDSFNNTDNVDSFSFGQDSLTTAKLQSCVLALQDVVGDTIPESALQKAAKEHGFDLEKALNSILQENAPKPQRARKPQASNFRQTNEVGSGSHDSNLPSNIESIKNGSSSSCTETVKKIVHNAPVSKSDNKSKKLDVKFTKDDRGVSPRRQRQGKSSDVDAQDKVLDKKDVPDVSDKLSNDTSQVEDNDQKIVNSKASKTEKSGKEMYDSERGEGKPLINLVVIGHVDAGKSTLMGHLLFNLGNISQRNMHKFERDSKKLGKGSFMYAWVLDETPEERNRGITMDVAQSMFETQNRSVTLLDAPGHKDFIPNMITGAAQADVAILVVDSTRGEFETGFEAGGQTREHTMLIRSLGVSELAVAVNKMDNVGWAEDRFQDIKTKMSTFLKQVGFKDSDVTFVPCSGLSGENLAKAPEEESFRKWYSGPTLMEVIDRFHPPERPFDKPFRMCVSDAFKGATGGFCAAGRIEAGFVKVGDKVVAMPAGEQATIKGISLEEQNMTFGFAGDHVVLQLSGVDVNNVSSGSMICSVERPVRAVTKFEARLVVFNISVPITKGFPAILHYQSLSEQAIIRRIVSQLNRSTGEVVKKNPRCLSKNTSAVVEVEVNRPICIELFKEFKDLGRFMLRSSGTTVAAGLVTAIP